MKKILTNLISHYGWSHICCLLKFIKNTFQLQINASYCLLELLAKIGLIDLSRNGFFQNHAKPLRCHIAAALKSNHCLCR